MDRPHHDSTTRPRWLATETGRRTWGYAALFVLALGSVAAGPPVKLVERAADPHGSPRPARDAKDVPLRTSLYLELGLPPEAKAGEVDPESVGVTLQPEGGDPVELLRPGRRFAEGASGWLRPKQDLSGAKSLAVYIEPGGPLGPRTRHTVRVSAGDTAAG